MSQLTTNTTTIESLITAINKLPESGTVELQEKSITPTTSSQTVSPDSGYDGLSKVTVNAMPTATQATPTITVSNAGLITASSTQTAGYVAAGTKSATKQLSTQAAQTITPGTSNKTIASGKYLTGTQTIKGDANLIPANIAEGISIFGVEGTMKAGGGSSFPNGTEWTKGSYSDRCDSIYYANGMWLLGGYGRYLHCSTDGKTWVQSDLANKYYRKPIYRNGLWVVACQVGIYYSIDGDTWIQGIAGTYDWVGYSNGTWVAGNTQVGNMSVSTDGKTWTAIDLVKKNIRNVYIADGLWVGASDASDALGLCYSTDGKTWTQSNISTGLHYDIVNANGIWVAGGVNILYSTDGKTWTESNATNFNVRRVINANGLWVACGLKNSKNGYSGGIRYSTDGKTWVQSNITDSHYYDIVNANGIWVATGDNILYSTDGKTWTKSNVTNSNARRVINANGLWVACDYSSGLYYSVAWEPST